MAMITSTKHKIREHPCWVLSFGFVKIVFASISAFTYSLSISFRFGYKFRWLGLGF